jgi:glycosyltransferase involved in cell wall biosynthesis
MKKVSIVMATYNGAPYIEAQLESIRRQTVVPSELWVSDDGSTDETLRIVSAFAERAEFPVRIRVNTQRLGYGENFLSAALLCDGDFIAFCDQGDEWRPEKLERCVEALEREAALLCVHTATLIDAQSQYIGYFDQGIAQTRTWPALSLPPWGVFFGLTQVFRRELLSLIDSAQRGLDNHTLNSQLSHDRWIYFLAQSLGKVVALAHPLVAYRQHGRNAYGGLKKDLVTRLRGKLVGSADIFRKHEMIALHRAQLTADFARSRRASPHEDQARLASAYWRRLGDIYATRAKLYDAPTFAERRLALGHLVDWGTYRSAGAGGFGAKVLAKDVALGLLHMPLSQMAPRQARPTGTPVRVEDKL